ncbi:MAG: undecaprenyldiphospho-muramoylpentapeptide beta-N-acetylglucosaminyltransferase [Magnetospirillum sp. WYHS-4]
MTAPLIVLAAGGTGGHVFPAEALAVELLGRGCRLALVTDRRGGAYGGALGSLETHRIQAGGLAGKSLLARLRAVPELLIGTFQARALLARLMPSVVVGFGGYASVPTMMAAALSGVATALHEQNAVLGRANRLLAHRVKRIATSFEAVDAVPPEARDRLVHTGMPVRPAIAAVRERPYPELSSDGPVDLLVLGGSQGARVLSDVLPAAVGLLPEGLRHRLSIVQQCRPEDLERTAAAYADRGLTPTLSAFFDDVPERLAACHLLIGRAGASTVAEATAVGRPSILVPYPHAIDDHQSANAHAVDEAGAGWLMQQDSFTPETLAARLQALLAQPAILAKAAACAHAAGRPDAAARLGDLVLDLLPAHERNAA